MPVWRTLPWRTLGAAGAAGLLTAGLSRLPGTEPDSRLALGLLRGAALAGALGLAFLLDDPARDGTTTVPTGRAARTALRVALVAPVAALWWAAALLLVPGAHRPPAGAVTLEAGTACALALAAATVAVRHSDDPRPRPAGGHRRPGHRPCSRRCCCRPAGRCSPAPRTPAGQRPTTAGRGCWRER
ncbi:hypothetical protein LT493_37945 [Streptomyces tricolor]|nr:hypothetical protein [Streptomyces tricolor]